MYGSFYLGPMSQYVSTEYTVHHTTDLYQWTHYD